MNFKDSCLLTMHLFLYFFIIIGVIALTVGFYFIAAVLIVSGALINKYYFKKQCLGYYYENRENIATDIIELRLVNEGEILENDKDVVNAEWFPIENLEEKQDDTRK